MEPVYKIRILEQEEIAEDVFYIKLEHPKGVSGTFIPGQLLALSYAPGSTVRYYSIASGNCEDFWGILYNRVSDGGLTPRLSGLRQGDSLYTSLPFGDFLSVKAPMVWIATGTGIAPFHSMVQSGKALEDTILVHGARQKKDFYFYENFQKSMDRRYIACSSVLEQSGFYSGRLSKYLKEDFSFAQCPEQTCFYLCGSSSMIVDIRDLLLSKGVEFDKIICEIYF
jgi:ferredoxin--NADP+ reductase